jgi:hypothetical protein
VSLKTDETGHGWVKGVIKEIIVTSTTNRGTMKIKQKI